MNTSESKAAIRRQAEEDFEKYKAACEQIEKWALAAFRRLLRAGERDPRGAAAKLVTMMFDDERFPCGIKRAQELTEDQQDDLMDVLRYRDLICPSIDMLIDFEMLQRLNALVDRVLASGNAIQLLFRSKN